MLAVVLWHWKAAYEKEQKKKLTKILFDSLRVTGIAPNLYHDVHKLFYLKKFCHHYLFAGMLKHNLMVSAHTFCDVVSVINYMHILLSIQGRLDYYLFFSTSHL